MEVMYPQCDLACDLTTIELPVIVSFGTGYAG